MFRLSVSKAESLTDLITTDWPVIRSFLSAQDTLLAALNTLCDSLTGLERILTTPIPFSYSIHLWTVTTIYVALLVSQHLIFLSTFDG